MRLLNILIVSFLLLTSCTIQYDKSYEWFQTQGFNLTECGVVATANILRSKGYDVTNTEIRDYHIKPLWWTFFEITDVLNKYNIEYTYLNSSINNIKLLKNNEFGLLYINNNHFILISNINNNSYIVYDSITGIYKSDIDVIYNKISYHPILGKYKFLKIKR